MEDPVFRHKMCVSIAMIKCMFSNVGEPQRLKISQVYDVLLCSQYPEKYRFDLDHLKYALSYKILRSILSDFGFEFEEDQKIEARKMEKMLDWSEATQWRLPKITNLCGNKPMT